LQEIFSDLILREQNTLSKKAFSNPALLKIPTASSFAVAMDTSSKNSSETSSPLSQNADTNSNHNNEDSSGVTKSLTTIPIADNKRILQKSRSSQKITSSSCTEIPIVADTKPMLSKNAIVNVDSTGASGKLLDDKSSCQNNGGKRHSFTASPEHRPYNDLEKMNALPDDRPLKTLEMNDPLKHEILAVTKERETQTQHRRIINLPRAENTKDETPKLLIESQQPESPVTLRASEKNFDAEAMKKFQASYANLSLLKPFATSDLEALLDPGTTSPSSSFSSLRDNILNSQPDRHRSSTSSPITGHPSSSTTSAVQASHNFRRVIEEK